MYYIYTTIRIRITITIAIALGTIDYASSYFKYKTPTPIRGEPSCKLLKRLKIELQANSRSVGTDLGGGNHGYLGLILTN